MSDFAFPPVPIETADEARSIFNLENVYLSIGDQIEQLISDLDLSALDTTGEKHANKLCLLAMVTIFQFAEKMPDRQATEALRRRTDWKYALHLSLVYPGLEPTALCEFRQQLLSSSKGQAVFHEMLVRLAQTGLFSSRTKNSMDAKSVILDVCAHSRLDWLIQAIGLSLEALAAYQPELLREISQPHWYERYNRMPTSLQKIDSRQEMAALGTAIGKDAYHLLEAVRSGDQAKIADLAEIKDLKRIFHQQFDHNGNQIRWLVVCSFCSGTKLSSLHQ